MANDAKAEPESKFAEVIRKGREKRAGMEPQTRDRADTDDIAQTFKIIKDSETGIH